MTRKLEQIFNGEKGIYVDASGNKIDEVLEIGYTNIVSGKKELNSTEVYEKAKKDYGEKSLKMPNNPFLANAYSIEGSSQIDIVGNKKVTKTNYSYLVKLWRIRHNVNN